MSFKLTSNYAPKGDQPAAIATLVQGLRAQEQAQTLLGVTGSGKTFTMANVINEMNRPTLVLSHNKTLAAQLYAEFREFFPDNAVEYFVSYYDYYQPEAYIPSTNVYIEKDLSINQEIEKLRLRATSSLLSDRRDVIVVASVSCIYGMSNPADFRTHMRTFIVGENLGRDQFLLLLVDLLYKRSETKFEQGTFRVRGDMVDVFLTYNEQAYRFFFFADEIEAIQEINPATGRRIEDKRSVVIFPGSLFMVSKEHVSKAIAEIVQDLKAQLAFFRERGLTVEAERLEERTRLDIDMIREMNYCPGIENYSRAFDGRKVGERPYCLLDYFPKDFLMFIDESHVSIPQIQGMWGGDHARKKNLVSYGFRIPMAKDNRPLTFDEFHGLLNQVIYVSATPANYELEESKGCIVEQVVRPTGLLDPTISVQPSKNQIDHLLHEIRKRTKKQERVLITTLTKKMAEKLTDYLERMDVRCRYIHSDVKTLDRVEILEGLRVGEFDVLVGVNLLREGLDLPEVSLVAITDADKEGFLRNFRSLIQTIGRTARHIEGHVIMYADKITPSMKQAIEETSRRREKQILYNKKHNIQPTAVKKAHNKLSQQKSARPKTYTITEATLAEVAEPEMVYLSLPQIKKMIRSTEKKIEQAAAGMDYVKAQKLQEKLMALESLLGQKNKKA